MFETLPDRARKEGMAQGMQQGMTQASVQILIKQLTRKFAPLTTQQEDALKSMTSDQLLEISDRIFDANSVDDLIRLKKD